MMIKQSREVLYQIEIEDIAKVVDCSKINNVIDEICVYIKLNQINFLNYSKTNIIKWAAQNACIGEIQEFYEYVAEMSFIKDDEEVLIQLVENLCLAIVDVAKDFEKATGVKLYLEYDYDREVGFFHLNGDDLFELTPKAKRLQQLKVGVDPIIILED